MPAVRWGKVQTVDTASMTVKVLLQPENVLTGFLPIMSIMCGAGWGVVHPPVTGQPVLLLPDAGDSNSYVVLGSTWSLQGMPPVAEQGELWLQHSTGTTMRLTNAGNAWVYGKNQVNVIGGASASVAAPDLYLQGDDSLTMVAPNGTTHIGNIVVMGTVTADHFTTTVTPPPALLPPVPPAPIDPSTPMS